MPELPEVETVVREIRPRVVGRTIEDAKFLVPRQLHPMKPAVTRRALLGQCITEVARRGKFILLHLSDGLLILHLRMTGRLYVRGGNDPAGRHERALFRLDNGTFLAFNDPRTLGTISFHRSREDVSALDKLGIEPLTGSMTTYELRARFRTRSTSVKPLLLDQSIWAGIGNIYASEILWLSGIHPEARAGRLTQSQLERLIEAVPSVLRRALEKGGSTLRDFMSPEGRSGAYQREFRVYDREGEPCLRCGAEIRRIVQAQRSTYFCPKCQKRR